MWRTPSVRRTSSRTSRPSRLTDRPTYPTSVGAALLVPADLGPGLDRAPHLVAGVLPGPERHRCGTVRGRRLHEQADLVARRRPRRAALEAAVVRLTDRHDRLAE